MKKGIFKNLDWDLWKDVWRNPIGYFCLTLLVIALFFHDLFVDKLFVLARAKKRNEAG